jgi:6-phosphogluconolactonase
VLPIGTDGRLSKAASVQQHEGSSVDPSRQRAPHAHGVEVDAANRFALAADLGIDKLLVYRFDAEAGRLTPHAPPAAALPPGSGPRHFAFDPGGRRVYVINELTNTIATFDWDAAAGRLSAGSTPWPIVSTLPGSFTGANTTAEIQVHPSGRFVYGSNRGHDSVAVFRVDEQGRRLVPVGHNPTGGKTPRHFTLTADGQWLLTANQASDTLAVYRVNQDSGALGPSGGAPTSVGSPVCIVFVPPAR